MGTSKHLARDPLWVSALLKADENRYFWYQRAHHIVYDGYGGGLVARRLAELYTAYAQGNEPEPNCFCSVETMVTAEAAYRSSDRFKRDREYWHQQLADLPEAVTLSRTRRRRITFLASDLLLMSGIAAFLSIQIIAWLQQRVESSFMGRVMSVLMFASVGLTPLSLAISGVAFEGQHFGNLRVRRSHGAPGDRPAQLVHHPGMGRLLRVGLAAHIKKVEIARITQTRNLSRLAIDFDYFNAQKIAPTANMNIAGAVEITGPISRGIFRQALHQLVAEAEEPPGLCEMSTASAVCDAGSLVIVPYVPFTDFNRLETPRPSRHRSRESTVESDRPSRGGWQTLAGSVQTPRRRPAMESSKDPACAP